MIVIPLGAQTIYLPSHIQHSQIKSKMDMSFQEVFWNIELIMEVLEYFPDIEFSWN